LILQLDLLKVAPLGLDSPPYMRNDATKLSPPSTTQHHPAPSSFGSMLRIRSSGSIGLGWVRADHTDEHSHEEKGSHGSEKGEKAFQLLAGLFPCA